MTFEQNLIEDFVNCTENICTRISMEKPRQVIVKLAKTTLKCNIFQHAPIVFEISHPYALKISFYPGPEIGHFKQKQFSISITVCFHGYQNKKVPATTNIHLLRTSQTILPPPNIIKLISRQRGNSYTTSLVFPRFMFLRMHRSAK